MKVLHCTTSTDVGGAQIMLLRYLRALRTEARQHAVLSLMPPGPIGDDIAALGVPLLSVDMPQGSRSPMALWKLRKILCDRKPEIVHGWMYHGSLAASLATLGLKQAPAVIWDMHHSLQDPKNESRSTRLVIEASRRVSSRTAGISYCSRISAKQHETFGYSGQHSTVIPNGIDTDEFVPDPTAKAALCALAKIPAQRTIIGNVGRDHPMKDQKRMVAVIARLVERGYDVHGVLLGAGQDVGSARSAALELGITDRITTLAERRDVPRIVAGFDIFLLPSAWGEAFPLAVCEAMACEVPAVVTDVGDSGWIVDDRSQVVPPADTEAQVAALVRLLNLDETRRKALGAAARKRICENFSMAHYIAAREAFYRESLSFARDGGRRHEAAYAAAPTAKETR